MKLFSSLLATAVVLSSYDSAEAASCITDTVCPDATACTSATVARDSPLAIAKPAATTCTATQHAYIKSLIIGTTDTSSVTVAFNNKLTAMPDATANCDLTYSSPIGNVNTISSDVQATVTCTGDSCLIKYKAVWACADNAAAAATTTCVTAECATEGSCTAATATKDTPFKITKPASTTCTASQHAYLTSLAVGGTTDATTVSVVFNNNLTATADAAANCASKYSSAIGEDATTDVEASVTCAADSCPIKYKAVWACGDNPVANATVTPAPAPTNSSSNSTKSGISALTTASPASLVMAVVAIVGGISFAFF